MTNLNIELGQLPDSSLILMSNTELPHDIRRIEYYRDQRLIMLIYDLPDHEGELMEHELSDHAAAAMALSPDILVVEHGTDRKMMGYDVPLIQIDS